MTQITKKHTLTLEEVAYTEKVVKLIESGSKDLIANGQDVHARILIHQMLLRATEHLRILSTNLRTLIYNDDEILLAMQRIIERKNIRIDILIQRSDKIANDNEFIRLCDTYRRLGKCSIKQVADPDSEELKEHFITMDNKAYRFCADATKSENDDDSIKAVASFNSPDWTEGLNRRFERLSQDAQDIDVKIPQQEIELPSTNNNASPQVIYQ